MVYSKCLGWRHLASTWPGPSPLPPLPLPLPPLPLALPSIPDMLPILWGTKPTPASSFGESGASYRKKWTRYFRLVRKNAHFRKVISNIPLNFVARLLYSAGVYPDRHQYRRSCRHHNSYCNDPEIIKRYGKYSSFFQYRVFSENGLIHPLVYFFGVFFFFFNYPNELRLWFVLTLCGLCVYQRPPFHLCWFGTAEHYFVTTTTSRLTHMKYLEWNLA